MNPGLIYALLKGGKAILMSKTVRIALAEYLLSSVRKHDGPHGTEAPAEAPKL